MTNHPNRTRSTIDGTITVYYFSPHNDQSATHARSTGGFRNGFRVAADISTDRLTPRAMKLLQMMGSDLSGLLDGDDLAPRAVVKERRIDIMRAAEILNLGDDGAEAARQWKAAYGDHCGDGIKTRQHAFMGMYHAAKRGDLVGAINAHADHPGLFVRNSDGEHQISSAVHVDDQRSAEAWAHILRPHTARIRRRRLQG